MNEFSQGQNCCSTVSSFFFSHQGEGIKDHAPCYRRFVLSLFLYVVTLALQHHWPWFRVDRALGSIFPSISGLCQHLPNSHGTPISLYSREARGDIRGVISEVHKLTVLWHFPFPTATVHTCVNYTYMTVWLSPPASYLSILTLCCGDKYLRQIIRLKRLVFVSHFRGVS